ncbi:52 kDa repressor of the inhibitor of the protein kinase-like isoform X1 [Metopolophium dirhodum]|nr:52 kDa repressor of the inhibitor of the protein kinase-like isoform X1 [Metopolophium dirhodum]
MSSWKDVTAVEANMLRNAMDSEFLISVQIIKVLFSYGLPLCKQLQSKDIDLKEMVGLAEDNVNALKQLRTNIEPEFKKIFDEAQKMAEVLDFQIVVKRINKRQINRANPSLSSEEPEDYFRVTICIPYIESFINQLELRFLEHHNIFKGFYCLFDNNEDSNEADFESLVSFYLTHNDLSTTLGELKMWKLKLARLNIKPSNGIDALKLCSPVIFPNIHMLLKILCTLPVSTATPERMFSNLKRVKSYLRNTMKEDRLNGLTMLSVYRNINLTPEEVIDELGQKPRKIDIVL